MQPHTGFSELGFTSAAPPTQLIRICSTSPVQEPQELAALVCFLISSTVNRPCSRMALTMVPLQTPLQPQTSALSAMPAARLSPAWPVSPTACSPNISWSRSADLLALSDQPEIPGAVGRIAIQAGAHQTVALDHQLL